MRNYSIFGNNNNNCLERNKTKKISFSTLSITNNPLPNFPFFIFVFSKRRPLRNKASNEKFFHSSSYLFFSPSNILRLGQFRLERERERYARRVGNNRLSRFEFRAPDSFPDSRDLFTRMAIKFQLPWARVVPPFYEIFTRPRNCACITCTGDQLRLLLFAFTEWNRVQLPERKRAYTRQTTLLTRSFQSLREPFS